MSNGGSTAVAASLHESPEQHASCSRWLVLVVVVLTVESASAVHGPWWPATAAPYTAHHHIGHCIYVSARCCRYGTEAVVSERLTQALRLGSVLEVPVQYSNTKETDLSLMGTSRDHRFCSLHTWRLDLSLQSTRANFYHRQLPLTRVLTPENDNHSSSETQHRSYH